MGQAKRRGPFEVRLAKAVARNQALEGKIADKPDMVKFARRYGMQRLSTRLIMSSLMTPPPA